MCNVKLKPSKKIYLWLVSLTLILHVFNSIEVSGIKIFQIPAILLFIINIINLRKPTRLQRVSILLTIITLLSALLSPFPEALIKSITFMIIIGACIGIQKVDLNYLIRVTNYLIPLSLAYLLVLLHTSIVWRFVGAYNDPNYMCTTLVVFLFVILTGIKLSTKKLWKLILISEIFVIIILAVATLSRTGIICIGILLFLSVWELIKKFKIYALITLFCAIGYIYVTTPPEVLEAVNAIASREDEHGNLSSAKNLRFSISVRGITYVLTHPRYIPIGMGIGSVGHWEYFDHYSNDNHIDHNTISATFSELGIIGFCLFVFILYRTFIVNKRLPKRDIFKPLCIGAYFSILIFSLSINQLTYLPFWWIIYLLNNTHLSYEYSSYCRLR